MAPLYTGRTTVVKRFRTPRAVPCRTDSVQYAYMGKRPRKPPTKLPTTRLRPLYQPTFIKAWREYRKMSQEELAALVSEYLIENEINEKGYTYASIGRVENGRMPYSQPVIEGIAMALRVPVATLIAIPPPKDGVEPPPNQEALMRLWNDTSRMVNLRR
jgi:transcriptional regulator with XRE-family HTH domain